VISNTSQLISGGEIALLVYRDGELVHEAILASPVTIQNGETTIDQPYIPASGEWEPGTYTFEVAISAGDVATGSTVEVGTFEIEDTIEIS